MDIKNICKIDYRYRVSDTGPVVSKTILSNIVSTRVIEDKLKINKYVNKESANSFDILIYTVEINNISNETINNLFFRDNIPRGTRFIENSVQVNYRKIRNVNPQVGFCIGKLKPCNKIRVSFNVLVIQNCRNRRISNKSNIEYDYLYNIDKPPMRVSKESNKVVTNCEKNIFNQIVVENIMRICTTVDEVLDIKCKVDILETKIINGNKDNYNLLVLGKVNYKILYKNKNYIKCLNQFFGFSVCMVVPKGAVYLNKVDVKVKIEDVSSNLLNKKELFISSTLFIYC